MRNVVTGLTIIVLLSTRALGQPLEPVRDPWKGFGLGSSVRIRTRVEIAGKIVRDERETLKVQSVNASGSAGVLTHSVKDGKESTSTRYHVYGGDPARLGLKVESKKDSTLTIEGREIPVTITKWISVKEKKDLEKIARSFPEILKQGSSTVPPNVEVHLTFYEAKLADVDVPYHEIATPGTDISVGPRVVKAEYRFIRLGEDMKPIAENLHVETVKQLKAEIDIKGKKARCVVIEIEGSDWRKNEKSSGTGEIWYSNDVPGREVKKTMTGDSPQGKAKLTMMVEEFEVRPDLPKFDLAKLVADKERTRIQDPTWNQMRLGAWYVSVREIHNRGPKAPQFFDVTLIQVVQIHDDGAYVIVSKDLTKDGWEVKEHQLISNPAAAKAADATKRVELILLGEKIACDEHTRKRSDDWSRSSSSEWLPVDEKWKKILAESGLKNLKETRSVVSKDSLREYPSKTVSLLVSKSDETFVAGKAIACFTYKSTTWDGDDKKPSSVSYQYASKAVPTWQPAMMSISPRSYSYTHMLDFGEADKTPPNVDQMRQYFKQTSPLLKRIDQEKLD